MIAILADHRVDHDLVTGQALLDDSWRQRSRDHSLFLARLASTLLTSVDQHEVLRRLHVQLGTLLVADHDRLFPAALTHALLRCALQDPLYTRKFAGSSCRPGCWCFVFVEVCTGGRSLSAWTSAVLTPGSSSSNSSCASESFSLPGPYFAMRTSRSRSSSTRIFSSAYCSLFWYDMTVF